MAEFLIAYMAPIMFSALVVFLLLGYPVAFSLAAVGMVFGLLGIELGLLTPNLLQAFPDRVFGIMKNEILLAIPFFTFMGLVLERSGMAEDLLDTIDVYKRQLRDTPLVAISPRTRQTAAEYGCRRLLLSENASDDAIVSTLLDLAANLSSVQFGDAI